MNSDMKQRIDEIASKHKCVNIILPTARGYILNVKNNISILVEEYPNSYVLNWNNGKYSEEEEFKKTDFVSFLDRFQKYLDEQM